MRVLLVTLLMLASSPDGRVELDSLDGGARHFWGFAVDEETCRFMAKSLELIEQGSAFACYAPDQRPVANERDITWLRLTVDGKAADYALMGTPEICARAARGLQRAYSPSAVWSCVPRHPNA